MNKSSSRRDFLKKTALTAGLASVGTIGFPSDLKKTEDTDKERPLKEVWIAGISQMDMKAETPQLMIDEITAIIEQIAVYKPDIIALPEAFAFTHVQQQLSLPEKLDVSKDILTHFSKLAKKNNCYLICPTYTSEKGKIYNSAVLFNREGVKMGEYRKIHLPEDEIKIGLHCGPDNPPVFKTDFGTIGIQICFDMMWDDGWRKLKEQGAEFVFWPSAYAGGVEVETKAISHKYIVATSTQKDTSKICDYTGEIIAKTGSWTKNFYCAPVNRNRVFMHIWPYIMEFDKVRQKYGRKVKITIYHEQEFAVLESRSPDILASDIIKEFNFRTYNQLINDSKLAQEKSKHQ